MSVIENLLVESPRPPLEISREKKIATHEIPKRDIDIVQNMGSDGREISVSGVLSLSCHTDPTSIKDDLISRVNNGTKETITLPETGSITIIPEKIDFSEEGGYKDKYEFDLTLRETT